ncbi:MAG: hypothetical protein ABJB12_09340 [Pseudomonadota bacterium]
MPLEFALRPRIRMRDDPPPRTTSRRGRWRVPRFALPAALYWAAVGGVCYGVIRLHDAPSPEPIAAARELAPDLELPSGPPPVIEVPAAPEAPAQDGRAEEAPAQAAVEQQAAPLPSLEPSAAPGVDEQPAAPTARRHALGADMSAALLSEHTPREAPQRDPVHSLSANASLNDLLNPDSAQDRWSERAPEPHTAPLPLPPPSRTSGASLPSCEAAAAAAVQDLDFASSDRTADLPSEAISGVLENGAWLSSCSLPSTTHLDVCVAIKGGRVTAATVISRPSDPALNACVKQRAAALQFPYSTRVDVARTRF